MKYLVKLSWSLKSEVPVARFEIERRTDGRSLGPLNNYLKKIWRWGGLNLFGGWRRIIEIGGNTTEYRDDGVMKARAFFRPTYKQNAQIYPFQAYEYRIRAVSVDGVKGPWRHMVVRPLAKMPDEAIPILKEVEAEAAEATRREAESGRRESERREELREHPPSPGEDAGSAPSSSLEDAQREFEKALNIWNKQYMDDGTEKCQLAWHYKGNDFIKGDDELVKVMRDKYAIILNLRGSTDRDKKYLSLLDLMVSVYTGDLSAIARLGGVPWSHEAFVKTIRASASNIAPVHPA
ncbi:hypothetical protein JW711_02205 [Candidatus Woesearchaeota archaeon]|nr:hypothetical protein [Candidatus Woesearchaeota archaeon]